MTIPELFEQSVEKFGNNNYLYEKKSGKFEGTTYSKVKELSYQFAAGLTALGVKKGDRLALLSEGRNEWVISELAILCIGAINVPLSVKLNEPEEILFRLQHSDAKIFISSSRQAKKIKPIKSKLPQLEKIIIFEDKEKYEEKETGFNEMLRLGKEYLIKHGQQFEKIWGAVVQDDLANICYTSGTTADPKGILLTHRNYTANVEQSQSLHDVFEQYKTLLILPWDHAFAHTCGIYTLMKGGGSLASIQVGSTPMETLKNIPVNIKEIKPDFLLSVPALAKNFKKNIESGIRAKGPKVEKLFRRALNLSYWYNGNGWNKGKGGKFVAKPLLWLYDKILFTKVCEGFGGNLGFFVGGGALLDIELQRFFTAIGIPMYQGYGLTEAAPVISSNNPKYFKMGSSGVLAKNLEVKICDEDGNSLPADEKGEIVVKGENVMTGYWKNDEATNETIKNGWLHTGDMGYLDKDGFLFVLGRFKSLLIADDGEKYSPEGIEEALINNSKLIDQCILYNNQNPYTVLLLVINSEALKRWAKAEKVNLSSEEGIKFALRKIEREISKYRSGKEFEQMFPQRWLPSATAILPEGFTEKNRLLNSTLKMVRGKIIEKYQETIDALYTPEAKNIANPENQENLKKFLSA